VSCSCYAFMFVPPKPSSRIRERISTTDFRIKGIKGSNGATLYTPPLFIYLSIYVRLIYIYIYTCILTCAPTINYTLVDFSFSFLQTRWPQVKCFTYPLITAYPPTYHVRHDLEISNYCLC